MPATVTGDNTPFTRSYSKIVIFLTPYFGTDIGIRIIEMYSRHLSIQSFLLERSTLIASQGYQGWQLYQPRMLPYRTRNFVERCAVTVCRARQLSTAAGITIETSPSPHFREEEKPPPQQKSLYRYPCERRSYFRHSWLPSIPVPSPGSIATDSRRKLDENCSEIDVPQTGK